MEKKQKILFTALKLFATEGVAATSTKKIALEAGVSEGLIFKHFISKSSLLADILTMADEKCRALFIGVFQEEDPIRVIQKVIEVPFNVPVTDYHFWRLELILKWQENFNDPEKTRPIKEKLRRAFYELNYEDPEMEAGFIYQTMEATISEILKGNVKNLDTLKWFLTKKYGPQKSA